MANDYDILKIEGTKSKNINQRIAECRKICGFTQDEMATLLGISKRTYVKIEKDADITVQMLYKLSDILQIDTNLFLPIYNSVDNLVSMEYYIPNIPKDKLAKPELVSNRMVAYRKLFRLTQADMAWHLGISTSAYSRMEKSGNIPISILFKICKILPIKPHDILCHDEPTSEVFYGYELPKSELEDDLVQIFRVLSKKDQNKIIEYVLEVYEGKHK